jgi:hypothetical protein
VLACLYHLLELFNVVHFFGFVGWMGYLVRSYDVYLSKCVEDHDSLHEKRFKGS